MKFRVYFAIFYTVYQARPRNLPYCDNYYFMYAIWCMGYNVSIQPPPWHISVKNHSFWILYSYLCYYSPPWGVFDHGSSFRIFRMSGWNCHHGTALYPIYNLNCSRLTADCPRAVLNHTWSVSLTCWGIFFLSLLLFTNIYLHKSERYLSKYNTLSCICLILKVSMYSLFS